MKNLYLTIDDSPSHFTDSLTDYLESHDIPAILFVRGAFMSDNPKPIIRAIEKGYIIGNHLNHHRRSSNLSFEEIRQEIEDTEMMIDAAYLMADKPRPYKLIRFPHMDRGCGAHIVDFDKYPEHKAVLRQIFLDGLNVKDVPPTKEMREKKEQLQTYLKEEGYSQPFEGVTHPFFHDTEMKQARDCMFTYSAADWMLTDRHKGKWPCKTTDDLIEKIKNTPYLRDENSADIICMHDDRENLLDTTKTLLRYWNEKNVRFIDI